MEAGEQVVFLSTTADGWWWVRGPRGDGWCSSHFLRRTGAYAKLTASPRAQGSVLPLQMHTDGSTDEGRGMSGCFVALGLCESVVYHPGRYVGSACCELFALIAGLAEVDFTGASEVEISMDCMNAVQWVLGWTPVGSVCPELKPVVLFARALLEEMEQPVILRWICREKNLAHSSAHAQKKDCEASGWREELFPVRRHTDIKRLFQTAERGQALRL